MTKKELKNLKIGDKVFDKYNRVFEVGSILTHRTHNFQYVILKDTKDVPDPNTLPDLRLCTFSELVCHYKIYPIIPELVDLI